MSNSMPAITNSLPDMRRLSSRPSTTTTVSFKLPSASVCDSEATSETESVLQQHYLRVQETLMSAVDRQVQGINAKVGEQESMLKKSLQDKEMLGVELYGTRIQVGRLNNTLAKMTGKIDRIEQSEKFVVMEADSLQKELDDCRGENKTLQALIVQLRSKSTEDERSISHLTEINGAYNGIQSRIQSKLKRELELSENVRKDQQAHEEADRRKMENLIDENKRVEQLLQTQKSETMRTQNAVDKMHRELNSLGELNRTLKKKWEDSLIAMEKRDSSLNAVQDSHSTIKDKLIEVEKGLRATTQEKEGLERQLKISEDDNASTKLAMSNLKTQMHVLEVTNKEGLAGLSNSQTYESIYKQELDKIERHHVLAKEELHRKNQAVSELTNALSKMRQEYDVKLKVEMMETFAKREEVNEAAADQHLRSVVKDHTHDNLALRHEISEIKVKMKDMKAKLDVYDASYGTLKSRYDDVHGHYVKLYGEAKQLIYALERKEHDVNYLKSILGSGDETDKTQTLKMGISKLQKELASSNLANEKLQNMWLESQKENLKCKGKLNASNSERNMLLTKLGVQDVVNDKTKQHMDDTKKDSIDSKFESAKLYNELRKLQPMVDELRRKNVELERQLTETRLRMEEVQINDRTGTQMLKTEVRRLYQDRQSVVKARLLDDRSTTVLERKYILVKEAYDKLKSERHEYQKHNFELKCRAEDMEKRASLRPIWGSLESTAGINSAKGTRPNSSATGANFSSRRSAASNNESLNMEEIPDFDAWRLKLSSLRTERDFLKNENDLVKRKLEELVDRIRRLEKSSNDAISRQRSSEQSTKTYQGQIESVSIRCQRAEKLAAFIEGQLKTLKPNTKIDYKLVNDVEPSAQLIAAMMVKEAKTSLT